MLTAQRYGMFAGNPSVDSMLFNMKEGSVPPFFVSLCAVARGVHGLACRSAVTAVFLCPCVNEKRTARKQSSDNSLCLSTYKNLDANIVILAEKAN